MNNKNFYEKSCGAIVFHKFENKYKILLINFLYDTLDMWGFPKGHVEANETEIQTSKREIKEETGLNVKIISDFRATTKFCLKKNVINEVVYFAATTNKTEIKPLNNDEKEIIVNSKWCSFNKAKSLLTFDCDKDILKQFIKFFKTEPNKF